MDYIWVKTYISVYIWFFLLSAYSTHLNTECPCGEHKRSHHIRRTLHRYCQTLTRSTSTGYSCTPRAHCTPACPQPLCRLRGSGCLNLLLHTRSELLGNAAHSDTTHTCRCHWNCSGCCCPECSVCSHSHSGSPQIPPGGLWSPLVWW